MTLFSRYKFSIELLFSYMECCQLEAYMMKRVQNFICFISNKLGSPSLQNGTTETWQSNLLIIEAYCSCMNITSSNFRIRSDNAMISVQKGTFTNQHVFPAGSVHLLRNAAAVEINYRSIKYTLRQKVSGAKPS